MDYEKDLADLKQRFAAREAAGQVGNDGIDWRQPVDGGLGRRKLADMRPAGGERDGGRRTSSRGVGFWWKLSIAVLALIVLVTIGAVFFADIDFAGMMGNPVNGGPEVSVSGTDGNTADAGTGDSI